jgi:hypothetical protein
MIQKRKNTDEKSELQILIEEAVGNKTRPYVWIFGILTTIIGLLVTVIAMLYAPVTDRLIYLSDTVNVLSSVVEKKINSEEAYKNFLPKLQYHLLQKAEHRTDREIEHDPGNSELIWMRHNNEEAESLDIVYRGSSKLSD